MFLQEAAARPNTGQLTRECRCGTSKSDPKRGEFLLRVRSRAFPVPDEPLGEIRTRHGPLLVAKVMEWGHKEALALVNR